MAGGWRHTLAVAAGGDESVPVTPGDASMLTQLERPFSLVSDRTSRRARLLSHCARPIERVLGLSALNGVYTRLRHQDQEHYVAAALDELGVAVEIEHAGAIPTTGPLLVVANHPFGAIEGLALLQLLCPQRPDTKVLVNQLLRRVSQLHSRFIFVDVFGGPGALRTNIAPLRDALAWLQGGHTLGVFPAGEVAHWTWCESGVCESPWSPMIGRLALRAGASVLPVFVEGCNGFAFQLAGCVHPRLRTAMLPHELVNKRGRTIRLRCGPVLPIERLRRLPSPRDVVRYLRVRTLALHNGTPATAARRPVPVAPPVATQPASLPNLVAEIESLPPEYTLATSGALTVYCAPAAAVPVTLREIGRLRELTFRDAGEGTGQALDLDAFDPHYHHLFVWNRETQRLIGAYRLRQVDVALREFGVNGLYTSTLFRFKPEFVRQLDGAIELGRSFVVKEHQRDFAPLMLLWKGIAAFMMRHPQYRALLGAVSISDRYDSLTKRLLMAFLELNCRDTARAGFVTPRRPFRVGRRIEAEARELSLVARSLDDIDEIIADLAGTGQGLPVLVRQYLKLNARVLGFNVDPDFGHVLDALMYADLATADPRILRRFFGREEAPIFLARHAETPKLASR